MAPKANFLTLALALLTLPVFGQASAGASELHPRQLLTLEEAKAFARNNAPGIVASRAKAKASGLELENAKSLLWPSLDFDATHGVEKTWPAAAAASPWRSQLSLALTEKLYDNGDAAGKQGLAKDLLNEVAAAREELEAKLDYEVTQAYYRLCQQRLLAEIKVEQATTTHKLFQSTENQYKQGIKVRRDFLRARSQAKSSDAAVSSAKAEAERALQDLRRLLGLSQLGSSDGTDHAPVAVDFVAATPAKDPVLKEALNRPDLKSTRLFRLQGLQRLRRERATSLIAAKKGPEFYLTTGANWGARDYLGTSQPLGRQDQVTWNVMLNMKYNLWDNGTRQREVEISLLQNEQEAATATADLLELQGRIDNLMRDFKEQQDNYQLNEELLDLENESYRLLSIEYREGRLEWLDLVDSLNRLLAAKTGLVSSWASLKSLVAQHQYLSGGNARSSASGKGP